MLGLFLKTDRLALLIKGDYAKSVGILHGIGPQRSYLITVGTLHGIKQHAGKALAVEDVVPQHQTNAVITDE